MPRFSIAAILIIAASLFHVQTCSGQSGKDTTKSEDSSNEGQKQLNFVLRDRPQLQSIVQKGSAISNWLIAAFSDTSTGIRIYWDNEPTSPNNPDRAESHFPDNTKSAYIRVDRVYKTGPSKGRNLSCEEVLSALVFELNNDKEWADNQRLSALVETGKIGREDYILSCAKTEFIASNETADFYKTMWVPFCQSNGLSFTPSLWGMPIESTFEKWLLRYPENSWYPWLFYGKRYDAVTAQREGDAKLGLENFNGAISAYSLGLTLGPRSYFWRGIAEMAESNWNASISDLRQADQLSLGNLRGKEHDQLLLWIARVQGGQKAVADHELSDSLNSTTEGVKDDWLLTIGKYLLDQIDEADFLAASASVDPQQNQQQQCESWFYAGIKRLLAGDKVVASQYFHNCLTTTQKDYAEYALARAELKILEQSK